MRIQRRQIQPAAHTAENRAANFTARQYAADFTARGGTCGASENRAAVCGGHNSARSPAKNRAALIFAALALAAAVFCAGCYEPSPLYGKWADNQGSQITFSSDGTFSARIAETSGSVNYSGDYTVQDNVLIFSLDGGHSVNTEWDIRGSILYLYWTDSSGEQLSLMLYHVSK